MINISKFNSLTTTGTSGAATLTNGILNVPNYATGSATDSFTMAFGTAVLSSPLASTVYIIGANFNFAPNTVLNNSPRYSVKVPVNCQIISLQFSTYIQGTFPTSENCAISVFNVTSGSGNSATSSYSLSSGNLSGGARNDTFTLASPLNCNAGDNVQIRIQTGAWSVAATNVFFTGQLYLQKL